MLFNIEISPDVAALGLAVGLIFSLICYLTTNLSPGGMITAGWLAISFIEDYLMFLITIGVAVATFALTIGARKVVILYGKRLFASIVLISVLLQTTLMLLIQRDFPMLFTHQTLGFVAPGLIAYQLIRQPKGATVLATAIVSAATFVVLASGILVGLVPTA